MRKSDLDAVIRILTDPENSSRTAEDVAELLWEHLGSSAVAEAKAELRAEVRKEIYDKDGEARRLAVVGQIQWPQGTTHTVVLGPFYAPGKLITPQAFSKAVTRPCADARKAGQGLAWDWKSKTGRGRFMLAPAFMKPRDAQDFFRGTEEITEEVAEALEALPVDTGPACLCGLKDAPQCFRHP